MVSKRRPTRRATKPASHPHADRCGNQQCRQLLRRGEKQLGHGDQCGGVVDRVGDAAHQPDRRDWSVRQLLCRREQCRSHQLSVDVQRHQSIRRHQRHADAAQRPDQSGRQLCGNHHQPRRSPDRFARHADGAAHLGLHGRQHQPQRSGFSATSDSQCQCQCRPLRHRLPDFRHRPVHHQPDESPAGDHQLRHH